MNIGDILTYCGFIPIFLAFIGFVLYAWYKGKPTKFAKWLREH